MPGLLIADLKCPITDCGAYYNEYTMLSHFKNEHASGIMLNTYEAEFQQLKIPMQAREPYSVFFLGLLCFQGREGDMSPVERGVCYPNDLPPNEAHLKTSLPIVALGCWVGRDFALWLATPTTETRIKVYLTLLSEDEVYECGKILRTRHLSLESQDPHVFMPHEQNYIYMSERHMLIASMNFTKPITVIVDLYEDEILFHL